MTELKPYRYYWNLPRGTKRFKGISHGQTWADALSAILEYHPKRTNITWVPAWEVGDMNEHPNIREE